MRLMSKARPSQKTRAGRHGFKKSPETAASGLILRLDDEFWVTGGYVTSLRNIVPAPFRPIKAATGCIRKSYRGIAVFRHNQMFGSDRACPTNRSNHSPLEGESQKPSRSLSRCPELVEGLSKGRRRLMRWGDRNTFLLAGSAKVK